MIWQAYASDDVVNARSRPWLWRRARWSRVRKWCYEMSWSGKARLAYGDGLSCGAGTVLQVVAHGFVRAQQ